MNEGVVGSGELLGCSVEMLTPSLQQAKRKGGGESWAMEKAGGQCRKISASHQWVIGSQVPRCLHPNDSRFMRL